MQITSFAPSIPARAYVDRYLVAKKVCDATLVAKMVPRCYPAFIFTAPDIRPIANYLPGARKDWTPGNVFFGSLGNQPLKIAIEGPVMFIVAMLHPHCCGLAFKEQASLFANSFFQVTHDDPATAELNETLWEAGHDEERIRMLDGYFLKKLGHLGACDYTYRAITAIGRRKGQIDMKELARQSFTCERNLRYKFEQHVGLSPKQYADMFRFNSLIKDLLSNPKKDPLTGNALVHNYYDLSHLNKDFLRFMGESPSMGLSQNQIINTSILSL